MTTQTYLIALGSNRWGRFGSPRALLWSFGSLGETEWFTQSPKGPKTARVIAMSRVIETPPLGHGLRRYANAVALIESGLEPPILLAQLKTTERRHGRRPGRRWGDRVLDLDIIGWSGGMFASRELSIPHPAFRRRRFVLAPLVEVAPDWRDPVTGLSARHLLARLDRKRPRA
jgi:2-amino-4-hydroxy-6-hydroxymethyldihydropteridine diphosphokinase